MRALTWLEDFNEYPPETEPAEAAPPEDQPHEPDPRVEAWTEGFHAGWRQAMETAANSQPGMAAADLIRHIEAVHADLDQIAARSAAQMGALLIDMLARVLPEDWPKSAAERLPKVIEAVRPAFHLNPVLFLHTDPPGQLAFHDLPGLVRLADETRKTEFPVTIAWSTHAEPSQLVDALKQALS